TVLQPALHDHIDLGAIGIERRWLDAIGACSPLQGLLDWQRIAAGGPQYDGQFLHLRPRPQRLHDPDAVNAWHVQIQQHELRQSTGTADAPISRAQEMHSLLTVSQSQHGYFWPSLTQRVNRQRSIIV